MRASQLLARPRRLVPPRVLAAGLGSAPPSGWAPLAAGAGVDPAPQSGPQPEPHEVGAFHAYGRTRPVAPGADFWGAGRDGLLFAFHLHGFETLARYAAGHRTATGDAFWTALARRWLDEAGRPALPAWHPFPTGRRIVAWLAALSAGVPDGRLAGQMRASARRQARYLARTIEHDIGGNHVLANAWALTHAGVCLRDARLERRGLALLHAQLARQVLEDGGHEERSPSYHRTVLAQVEDVVSLLERDGRPVPPWLAGARSSMTRWLDALTGPDGRLPLLNDAWDGPARERRSEAAIDVLAATGHVVLRDGGDMLVVDAGPLAPAHLPPHAHADALSIVLWADGAPVLVDSGALAYTGPERREDRATRAHSTVEVDDEDQCVLWGDFRAAFMPRVELLGVAEGPVTVVRARHDGYRRLPDPVVHERIVCWAPGAGVVVLDRLLARRPHRARTRLQAAPDLPRATDRLGPFAVRVLGPLPAPTAVPRRYARHLGSAVEGWALEARGDVEPLAWFGWSLLRSGAAARLAEDALELRLPGRGAARVVLPGA